jgi:hypothetical protein
VRELLRVRAEQVASRIPSITRGAATYDVSQSCVHAQWPTQQGETLHLLANLSDEPCAASSVKNAKSLFSSTDSAENDRLTRWEVRLLLTSST